MNELFTIHHYDFSSLPWLTNTRKELGTEAVALGLIHLPAGQGYSFTHHHRQQEEVYMVIDGRGSLYIDDRLIDIEKGDFIRVSPKAERALKAADGCALFIICSGAIGQGFPKNPRARYMIDDGVPNYDNIPPWYQGDAETKKKNAKLKARMEKAAASREQSTE